MRARCKLLSQFVEPGGLSPKPNLNNPKTRHKAGLWDYGGEGGMNRNSLGAVATLRASRMRARCKLLSQFVEPGGLSPKPNLNNPKTRHKAGLWDYGGEGGIRTLDRGLAYTPLAGERLQPLGHLTVLLFKTRLCALFITLIIQALSLHHQPGSALFVALLLTPSGPPCGRCLRLLCKLRLSHSATSPYYSLKPDSVLFSLR